MTREEILQAAALIFSQKGFHATSMQDIAGAVSLQKASLYHHFPSKQEILLEILNQALDTIIERLQTVLEKPYPPEEKLRRAMICYIQTLAEHQPLAQVLLLDYRSLDHDLRMRHQPKRDHFERLWRDLVQEGQEAAVFDCKNPSLTGRAILGVMNWTVTWYRLDGPLPVEAIADHFTGLFLNGLLLREPLPPGVNS